MKNLIPIYVFSLVFALCAIIILYKLFNGYLDLDNNTYIEGYKYIYEVIQYEIKEVKSKKIQELEELQKINSDIVALIEIENTNINYPVVQTSDNSYYLTHNYKKEKSKDGALMLDKDCSLTKPTTNFLIYGHNNIGSNEMFSDLVKYKNKAFYEAHKTIKFTTNNEEATYEIICVFLSQVYYKSQTDVFKYYFFIDAKNKEEFDNYILNCKNLSIYEIDKTVEYGNQIMTLSTCDYSRRNGRLGIIAKKIK